MGSSQGPERSWRQACCLGQELPKQPRGCCPGTLSGVLRRAVTCRKKPYLSEPCFSPPGNGKLWAEEGETCSAPSTFLARGGYFAVPSVPGPGRGALQNPGQPPGPAGSLRCFREPSGGLSSQSRVFPSKPVGIQEPPWNLIPVQKYALNLAQGTSPAVEQALAFPNDCVCRQSCVTVRPNGCRADGGVGGSTTSPVSPT